MSTSEQEYLDNYHLHDFDIPLTSVDVSIFTVIDSQLKILLVKRNQFPEKGKWALPGGFVDLKQDSDLNATAKRKLFEKTGVDISHIEQVETVGNQERDPRGWSLTVTYMALIAASDINLIKDDSSEDVAWVSLQDINILLPLAFDHEHLITLCHQRLQSKVQYTSLAVNLLPGEFTLSELQKIFELLLDRSIEKKSFRRRVLDGNIFSETGNMKSGSTRPAKLYRLVDDHSKHYVFPRSI